MKLFSLCIILQLLLWSTWDATAQPDQNPYWTRNGIASFNLSQASLSSWSAGGESAIGLDALLTYTADYKKERHLLNNRLELAY